ncbi:helix-turn-helix transcriptional regulator [Melaminivora jejuensis]|uniref:helix-turn-helix transcriptional regulator n=1 Tax=Melaminivora jejuensis TaxID=1267217 RepID=UPI002D7EE07F|nr:helix-turn-helix domain-containing protein [Melaminivora jejuensis]
MLDQLAPHLRSLRKARGLSQAELARRLGVTQSRIAAIEHNPAVVSVGQLMALLHILDAEFVVRDRQQAAATPLPSSAGALRASGDAQRPGPLDER